ncbi:MAG: DUF4276 family protein [Alphaproteobacteria bacterium]|nr:DUF4276 family protein [Alphaproteobacteria bacterium]
MATEMCLSGRQSVEIAPVTTVRRADGALVDNVMAGLREVRGHVHILFPHQDGGGDWQAARRDRCAPSIVELARRASTDAGWSNLRIVPVVPVREMEAWPLADPQAIATALGIAAPIEDLDLPARPEDVESIRDPKQVLERIAFIGLRARRRKRRRLNQAPYLSGIAERIDLVRLRRVPAFQRLEEDFREALVQLGYL